MSTTASWTASQSNIGAKPIRWSWWLAGLAISMILWLAIAGLAGWL